MLHKGPNPTLTSPTFNGKQVANFALNIWPNTLEKTIHINTRSIIFQAMTDPPYHKLYMKQILKLPNSLIPQLHQQSALQKSSWKFSQNRKFPLYHLLPINNSGRILHAWQQHMHMHMHIDEWRLVKWGLLVTFFIIIIIGGGGQRPDRDSGSGLI